MEGLNKAFLEAYNMHADAIFRFCYFKLNDRELAKDFMQETFTKAWVSILHSDKEVDNIRAFLYRIAGNLIIDEYRRRGSRGPSESLDDLREQGFEPSFSEYSKIIDALDGEIAISLIGKIKEPYGEAVFMRYVQELTLLEIAEITGESENTISVRVHRGLNLLKKLYHHEKGV